ncbi:heme exporter protein CcmD [Legionella longbeachae]|uniref:Heme exporter protein D n=1 Tax=Legionella longbeachae serogroup 1 (strain NSW150) TaxID=661367 RepID=D3HIX1_LEGLN|nr:heme exporter protein CcmD [Legionella longbeachae]HBD7398034.1 heme exporter protein CcmD [Legionella pneumophila]ARB90897.1 heme exporter CcmD [Legionella longbeachae]ARM32671.1 heme exporter protein CcmD [Legionella longbeachae]EEZ94551.1 heme exporter protein CcmD [Legionella longbeachae D-4968]QEY51854.1 heme exporter protein CcmD [Legionella longbeachae]
MNQFLEWITMGGYSIYVWSAYGLVSVVIVMNLLGMKWKRKQTRQKLQQWFKR